VFIPARLADNRHVDAAAYDSASFRGSCRAWEWSPAERPPLAPDRPAESLSCYVGLTTTDSRMLGKTSSRTCPPSDLFTSERMANVPLVFLKT
jgi:hypothetical protein